MSRLKVICAIVCLLLTLTGPSVANAIVVDVNALWYGDYPHPKLSVPLAAGNYSATLIMGSYTAWKYAPIGTWNTTYVLITSDNVIHNGGEWRAAASALDAFNQTTVKTMFFTQPSNGNIQLYFGDNKIIDNSGGVSLVIEPVIPISVESSTWGKVKALYR